MKGRAAIEEDKKGKTVERKKSSQDVKEITEDDISCMESGNKLLVLSVAYPYLHYNQTLVRL